MEKSYGEVESDGEDSFFDLVFESPHRAALGRSDDVGKKDFRFVESPRDVLFSKSGFSSSKDSSPVTLLRSSSSPRFKVFLRFSFRKSCEKTLRDGDSISPPAGDNSLRSQLLKETSDCEASPERTVPKYLKLIKPLYRKVWKGRNEKKANPMPSSPAAKRLVKSRSTSAAVGAPPSRRKDDSLVDKHEGIQGAVLYCKKSFNSSSKEISQLFGNLEAAFE